LIEYNSSEGISFNRSPDYKTYIIQNYDEFTTFLEENNRSSIVLDPQIFKHKNILVYSYISNSMAHNYTTLPAIIQNNETLILSIETIFTRGGLQPTVGQYNFAYLIDKKYEKVQLLFSDHPDRNANFNMSVFQ
jgi:hypothetical protein